MIRIGSRTQVTLSGPIVLWLLELFAVGRVLFWAIQALFVCEGRVPCASFQVHVVCNSSSYSAHSAELGKCRSFLSILISPKGMGVFWESPCLSFFFLIVMIILTKPCVLHVERTRTIRLIIMNVVVALITGLGVRN